MAVTYLMIAALLFVCIALFLPIGEEEDVRTVAASVGLVAAAAIAWPITVICLIGLAFTVPFLKGEPKK